MNPTRPIILTLNGQNQGEFSQILVRKHAEFPFLSQRLICHVDCNHLSPTSKRQLFVSNREVQRDVKVRELIQQEIIKALRSDDVLVRLNEEARKQGAQEQDEDATQQMRREVSRLLRLQGVNLGANVGGATGNGQPDQRPRDRRRTPRPPEPIELHEPPTFIRIIWDSEDEITFYPEQRRYLRITTDANSTYHNPNSPQTSRVNIIVGEQLVLRGSTALQNGRMRAIIEGAASSQPGHAGKIRVELTRPGLPMLQDERAFRIVPVPESRPSDRQVTLPPFKTVPVDGLDDPKWATLGWPDNPAVTASEAEMEDGTLTIYYSTAFPQFAGQRSVLERKDVTLANSYVKRYEIWLAVHSLLHYQDSQKPISEPSAQTAIDYRPDDSDSAEERERQERCRIATLSSLFAAREVQLEAAQAVTIQE